MFQRPGSQLTTGNSPDARLPDVIVAIRADERRHREVNHALADTLA
jgi:hypothetical protein